VLCSAPPGYRRSGIGIAPDPQRAPPLGKLNNGLPQGREFDFWK